MICPRVISQLHSEKFGSIRELSLGCMYFDYPRLFINRINEVFCLFFSVYIATFYWKKNFIYNRLFCCNHFYYCVGMVYVTSALHYATSASRYQNRSSMYIWGLIPRNWPRQFGLIASLTGPSPRTVHKLHAALQ